MSCCADCAGERCWPCSKLHKPGVVTSRGTMGLPVQSDGEDQTISIRPHMKWLGPRLLGLEQIIESIECLRDLISERATGDD